MKSVYETSTALDAHMILNLLGQEGIEGRVDGEYLPGGVGELQAVNLVRVMVDETDYERAARIIRNWEAIETENGETAKNTRSGGASFFLAGAFVGGVLIYWAYNTPVTGDGIDVNGDGILDEVWTYRDHRLSRTEVDRNLDGNVDAVYDFDRRGILKESRQDDNFDGIFESVFRFDKGLTRTLESDLNQDGNVDYRAQYRHGVMEEALILGEGRDFRRKRQKFHMGKLVSAEYDSDGDGNYDIEYEYDYFEEVKTKSGKRLQIETDPLRQ
jgi:hypothetical protein